MILVRYSDDPHALDGSLIPSAELLQRNSQYRRYDTIYRFSHRIQIHITRPRKRSNAISYGFDGSPRRQRPFLLTTHENYADLGNNGQVYRYSLG